MSRRRPRQLIVLVDALGWLTVQRTGFLSDLLPFRRRLTTVFGYSSTAIPSLLTGSRPVDHGHWFLFRLARGHSPFGLAKWVARLPMGLGNRWRVRVKLQEYWRKQANIQGYFSLYNIPMPLLSKLEPVEEMDTWAPGAFPNTPSFVDYLVERGDPYHLSDWRVPDKEKIRRAMEVCRTSPPETVVLYLTEIDAVQHRVGTRHPELDAALGRLEKGIRDLVNVMRGASPVAVSLFSDHGMTDITSHENLLKALEDRNLRRGRDFEGFLDSTVARFWEVQDEEALKKALEDLSWGRTLDRDTLRKWGVDFPRREYGDLFFLADPGVLILPSDMGREPLAAMHGYDPADPTADACFLADRAVNLEEEHITAVLAALKQRLEEGA